MAIRHKRTTTTGYTWQTSDLVEGQIGLNLADGTAHIRKSDGSIATLGSGGGAGTQGIQGVQGATGTNGTIGVDGAQGIQGIQGADGIQGTSGFVGSNGSQGIQGIQGLQGGLIETVYSLGTTSGTITPDFANGSVQTITLNGNLTWNAFTTPVAGETITLIINTNGTNRTLTSTMKFAGGMKTLSTTNTIDIMSVFYDGTTYYASLAKGYV